MRMLETKMGSIFLKICNKMYRAETGKCLISWFEFPWLNVLTNFDFLISLSLQPNVIDLRYFKV